MKKDTSLTRPAAAPKYVGLSSRTPSLESRTVSLERLTYRPERLTYEMRVLRANRSFAVPRG